MQTSFNDYYTISKHLLPGYILRIYPYPFLKSEISGMNFVSVSFSLHYSQKRKHINIAFVGGISVEEGKSSKIIRYDYLYFPEYQLGTFLPDLVISNISYILF